MELIDADSITAINRPIKPTGRKYKINEISEVESFRIRFLVLRNYIYITKKKAN